MMLDVADRRIVLIGGGAVASRKAAGIAAAGARQIRVISIEFRAAFGPGVERIQKAYDRGDLKNADLVFASTDSSAVNDRIVQDAKAAGILVCRADGSDAFAGDFTTPAYFQTGAITVTVSAQSPALAAVIRDAMKESFDPAWILMADAMQSLRPMIKSLGMDSAKRARLFRTLASPEARRILCENGIDGLKSWILTEPLNTF